MRRLATRRAQWQNRQSRLRRMYLVLSCSCCCVLHVASNTALVVWDSAGQQWLSMAATWLGAGGARARGTLALQYGLHCSSSR